MRLLLQANALHIPLADASVQMVATSPPYYGLRDYGVDGQIGLERTPAEYVAHLVTVFREVWRVLKNDGVVWLNLGDSYAGMKGKLSQAWSTQNTDRDTLQKVHHQIAGKGDTRALDDTKALSAEGYKPKDLLGIPWRVAFALQSDGWYLRSDIIWSKPNPMPESVTDRPTKAHEYVFLLSKQERYYYDAEAVKEKGTSSGAQNSFARKANTCPSPVSPMQHRPDRENIEYSGSRNRRTVWTVATQSYIGAHFATWPEKLVEPMILAGSRAGDIVLDPFSGSGTTGRVAIRFRRRYVGLELNREYIGLAQERINGTQIRAL